MGRPGLGKGRQKTIEKVNLGAGVRREGGDARNKYLRTLRGIKLNIII